MGTTSAFPAKPLESPAVEDPLTTADSFADAVRSSLGSGQAGEARRAAAQGAAAFPGDPWLRKANRVLNPSRIVSKPATAPDRTREFAWLRKHSAEYRGRWVALLGEELLSSGTKLEDVLSEVRSHNLDTKPLIHYIE